MSDLEERAYARGFHDAQEKAKIEGRFVIVDSPEIAALRARIKELEAAVESQAARDVLAERHRQIAQEGWTADHDDDHQDGEMALAACAYAYASTREGAIQSVENSEFLHDLWPWDEEWWKPTSPRRNLVKAAALLIAEIERLDRR